MKKFVSMAMVAAMTTSMVPATAFAGAGEVSAKAYIVDAWTMTKDFDGEVSNAKLSAKNKTVPELHIEITDVNYKQTKTENAEAEITVSLDNAELIKDFNIKDHVKLILDKDATGSSAEITEAKKVLDKAAGDLTTAEGNLATAKADTAKAQADLEKAETDAKVKLAKEQNAALALDVELAQKDLDAAKKATSDAQGAVKTKYTAYDNAVKAEAAAEKVVTDAKDAWNALGGEDNKPTEQTELSAWAEAKKDYYDAKADYEGGKKYDLQGSVGAYTDAVEGATEVQVANATKTTTAAATASALTDYKNAKTALEAALKAYDPDTKAGTVVEAYNTAVEALDAVKVEAEDIAKEQPVKDAQAALATALKAYNPDTKEGTAVDAVTKAEGDLAKAEEEYKAVSGKDAAGNSSITFEAVDGILDAAPKAKALSGSNGEDKFTFLVKGELHEGDVIAIDLETIMDKTSVGRTATLDVESDDLGIDTTDLVYVGVEEYGITATTDKIGNIAEEEYRTLEKDLKIESVVGDIVTGQTFELKLSNGFEFKDLTPDGDDNWSVVGSIDKDEVTIKWDGADTSKFTIDAEDIEIEATSAKSGKEAVLTIKAVKGDKGTFKATSKVTLLKVVDYTVMMTVDEDEDVPVIYSGVDVNNYGITDDSDHLSLEVTVEESFPGAWSMRKGFNFELPDGVYVTNVDVLESENFNQTPVGGAADPVTEADFEVEFGKAYRETDHKGFEFKKHVFDDINTELADEVASVTFQMELVADPGFVGDVNLKFTGDLVDEQEVTIAKFATPYYVTAEQNDLKIDYRYTSVPTEVVITEAEAGLWDKDEAWFTLVMDHADESFFEFEDAVVTVDEESGMEIKDDVNKGGIKVGLEDDSDDTAAVITVSDMEMFMSRSIPAGPYDLEAVTSLAVGNGDEETGYLWQKLFAPDDDFTTGTAVVEADTFNEKKHTDITKEQIVHDCDDCDEEYYVGCVADFSNTVKEAFINVVTAGREQDDASFTTKVVVPVGESYIVAGENQITLDVPAYVSAAGYTMLPVRAVATALGINNNNVIWNGETKTVTILYGQRIITMVAGQKTVNVNGSVIPASAAVEIVDGRTFLPMRDLATALGVTDITWDAATKTATLNGGVVAE